MSAKIDIFEYKGKTYTNEITTFYPISFRL
ncbi:hypothetical protein EV200_104309 [Pedobacter psychrotolerans]|uniref:Uncharacterized protein n=1 Tax=Pedobacter psychrotolerans TaxID=1843235 RepID=A0A4R2HCZ3_9SPHI|nr:hypothetical protein EV200_104309 [Pedobacter psychrotolerans]